MADPDGVGAEVAKVAAVGFQCIAGRGALRGHHFEKSLDMARRAGRLARPAASPSAHSGSALEAVIGNCLLDLGRGRRTLGERKINAAADDEHQRRDRGDAQKGLHSNRPCSC